MNKTSLRRTEVTIETREVKTIRIRSLGGSIYCSRCSSYTASYAPEHVALYLQLGVGDVLRSIAAGDIHTIENEGSSDLCGNSLKNLTTTIESLTTGDTAPTA